MLTRASIGQNRTPSSKVEENRAGSGLSELTQELDRIRSQSRQEFAQTSFDKILLKQEPSRPSIQTTRTSTGRLFTKAEESTTNSFFNENPRMKSGTKKKDVTEAIPLAKLYELQSAIRDADDEEINNLPEQ